jgi:hypothetical protein
MYKTPVSSITDATNSQATTDSTQQASQVESIRLTQEGDKLKVEYLVSLAQNSRVWYVMYLFFTSKP